MLTKSCVVLGCVLSAVVAVGQKGDSFDKHVADYRLLLSKKVQAEVGITVAQRAALNKAADHERQIAQPYLQQLQREGKNAQQLSSDQKYLGFLLELRDNVLGQLTAPQLKRLRELSLQAVDIGGVLDVVVAKRIGMSVAQLTKVRSIYGDGVKRSNAIVKAVEQKVTGPFINVRVKTQAEAKALNDRLIKDRDAELKKRQPEFDRLSKETKRSVEAVLTAKQLAEYHALQGKPFKP
jgi:hypothetical protein